MGHRVAAVDGEDVGLVGVVLRIRVEGADPDYLFGRQVVDLNGLAGEGVGAGVEQHVRGGRMEGCQLAEGSQPGPGVGAAGADEVVLEAAGHAAELGGGGGVGDDAISRGRAGAWGCDAGVGAGIWGRRRVRHWIRRRVRCRRVRRWIRRWVDGGFDGGLPGWLPGGFTGGLDGGLIGGFADGMLSAGLLGGPPGAVSGCWAKADPAKAMVKRTANRTANWGDATIRRRPAKRDEKFIVCLLPANTMRTKPPSISSFSRDVSGTDEIFWIRTARRERKFHLVYGDSAFAKPGGKPGMYGCEVGFAGSRGRGRR